MIFFLLFARPHNSPLFLYTTLFRSTTWICPIPGRARIPARSGPRSSRSEEHTSELQSLRHLVCRLLLEKKNNKMKKANVSVHKDGGKIERGAEREDGNTHDSDAQDG